MRLVEISNVCFHSRKNTPNIVVKFYYNTITLVRTLSSINSNVNVYIVLQKPSISARNFKVLCRFYGFLFEITNYKRKHLQVSENFKSTVQILTSVVFLKLPKHTSYTAFNIIGCFVLWFLNLFGYRGILSAIFNLKE